jgi:hypothetical protein
VSKYFNFYANIVFRFSFWYEKIFNCWCCYFMPSETNSAQQAVKEDIRLAVFHTVDILDDYNDLISLKPRFTKFMVNILQQEK